MPLSSDLFKSNPNPSGTYLGCFRRHDVKPLDPISGKRLFDTWISFRDWVLRAKRSMLQVNPKGTARDVISGLELGLRGYHLSTSKLTFHPLT